MKLSIPGGVIHFCPTCEKHYHTPCPTEDISASITIDTSRPPIIRGTCTACGKQGIGNTLAPKKCASCDPTLFDHDLASQRAAHRAATERAQGEKARIKQERGAAFRALLTGETNHV